MTKPRVAFCSSLAKATKNHKAWDCVWPYKAVALTKLLVSHAGELAK